MGLALAANEAADESDLSLTPSISGGNYDNSSDA